ncbi:frataxin, mitochondrial [Exaiptasia diaphana]|uniref:ferroxidase n=1 Tax=Exaiptasia diaphana TaxID=2652724 RepID=A0A913XIK2_EXADI|nr:frataxin, mitochondrial [Exaiptasia diaphana]
MLGRLRCCASRSSNFLAILLPFRRSLSNAYIHKDNRLQYQRNFESQQIFSSTYLSRRQLSNFQSVNDFHHITDETLEALSDFFDSIADKYNLPDDYDVNFGDGVLTVHFGGNVGTYVINKQTPNQQIWLSSPSSGPKRYDFISNTWIYKRNNQSLHELLSTEVSAITGEEVDLTHLSHGGKTD